MLDLLADSSNALLALMWAALMHTSSLLRLMLQACLLHARATYW